MPRPRSVDDQTLKSLEQQLERARRKLQLARTAQKDQARRDDTRRKIIAGALALEHLEKNAGSEFGKVMFRLLDEYARPEDRRLFEFLPNRETAASDATAASNNDAMPPALHGM